MYGWGATSGPMYTCPTGESVFNSSDCPGGGPPSGSALDQMRGELDALWAYTRAGEEPRQYPGGAMPCDPGIDPTCGRFVTGQPSATQWLNANAGKVALGVGGLFAILLLAKAGR